jgi:ATP-binding cassette subfamily B protein
MRNPKHAANISKTLARVLSYFKPYWFLLVMVILTAIGTALSNIFGTFFAGKVTDHILDYFNQENNILKETAQNTLTHDIILIVSLYAGGVFCALFHNELMVFLTQKVLYRLRNELMSKMQELPISYFDTHTHGAIMTLYTNDIDALVNALNDSLANIFVSATNMVGTIVCLFIINVPLTLIVIFFIIVMLVFLFVNAKLNRKYFVQQQKALADVNAVVEEDIAGVKVIKAFNHEDDSFQKFEKANIEWRKAATNSFFRTQVTTPFFVSISYLNFSISAVAGVTALCTGWAGALTFGGLQSYLVFCRNACQPFNYFTLHLNNILAMTAGAERIFAFLDEDGEEDDGKVELVKLDDHNDDFTNRYGWKIIHEDGSEEIKPLRGVIQFKDVHFSYVKGHEVLKGISFEAHPGKKVAFVGSTGAGKTTIISLLARFYPIDSGSITYDDISIYDIKLESLRRALSMVTQDTHLFTESIEDNIRYVRRHSTSEEIRQAAEKSHADSFIRRSPQGYQTMLYDDGSNLSEGQRQLLGLTRATLNQPPVMILDEATSNIDTRSELLIQQGLNDLMKERTVMVIAHRLSTIRDADEIMVLDHGIIIERGTQDELLALKGSYYDLYTGKVELA